VIVPAVAGIEQAISAITRPAWKENSEAAFDCVLAYPVFTHTPKM
jgi:hypothetical protein